MSTIVKLASGRRMTIDKPMHQLLEDHDVIIVERIFYHGKRRGPMDISDEVTVNAVTSAVQDAAVTIPIPQVVKHSPTGMEYGYGGSGPADLALTILTACVGINNAERNSLYHLFKFERVAGETADRWTIKVGTVREWVSTIEGRKK